MASPLWSGVTVFFFRRTIDNFLIPRQAEVKMRALEQNIPVYDCFVIRKKDAIFYKE